MTTDTRFELSSSIPVPLRVVLGAVGAFLAFIVVKELGRGVWPLTLATPIFLLIVGGGVLVGLTLIVAMIWGPDERWVIARGRLTITRTLRAFRSERAYKATDIRSAEVVDNPSDGGPDTYELVIKLNIGKTLRSPNIAEKSRAEAACRLLGF